MRSGGWLAGCQKEDTDACEEGAQCGERGSVSLVEDRATSAASVAPDSMMALGSRYPTYGCVCTATATSCGSDRLPGPPGRAKRRCLTLRRAAQ
jgi:hypothetical protein